VSGHVVGTQDSAPTDGAARAQALPEGASLDDLVAHLRELMGENANATAVHASYAVADVHGATQQAPPAPPKGAPDADDDE
jgi:hypothetical protein